MKKIVKILLSLMLLVSFNSCSDSNNVADDVLNDFEVGAILRTLEVLSATLNSSDPSSFWSVSIEYQDEEDGALLASVDVYVSIRDLTTDNGTTVANDMFIKSYDVSEFDTNTLHGLPRIIISVTFAEAESALGLSSSDHAPGDLFVFELRANLTDGRVFGGDSGTGILSGGYFSSPFFYNALILCSPQPGDYLVDMHDSFGDGWQTNAGNGGDGIHVTIDGVITVVGMCSPYGSDNIGSDMDPALGLCTGPTSTSFFDASDIVTIPDGAEEATWNFPGDTYGEISFEVYAPDGSLVFEGLQGETGPGLLPIAVCATN